MPVNHPLAARLAEARRTRKFLEFDPAIACRDSGEAYAVQAAVAGSLGTKPAGWKVGLLPGGAGWAAPVFASDAVSDGGMFSFSGDCVMVKVEAELGLRFGRDLPPRSGTPYSRDEILDAVSHMFAGIELVGTRFRKGVELPFATRLADNFANTAYAASQGTANFRSLDLARIRCRLTQDGRVMNDRIGGHQQGDPMIPVIAWANAQADCLGGIKAGQFITTGTLIEPYDLSTAVTLVASLEDVSQVTLSTRLS